MTFRNGALLYYPDSSHKRNVPRHSFCNCCYHFCSGHHSYCNIPVKWRTAVVRWHYVIFSHIITSGPTNVLFVVLFSLSTLPFNNNDGDENNNTRKGEQLWIRCSIYSKTAEDIYVRPHCSKHFWVFIQRRYLSFNSISRLLTTKSQYYRIQTHTGQLICE